MAECMICKRIGGNPGLVSDVCPDCRAKVKRCEELERAVNILRVACERQDGVPIKTQSTPENMAMWAIAKIERLRLGLKLDEARRKLRQWFPSR